MFLSRHTTELRDRSCDLGGTGVSCPIGLGVPAEG
jgi:hypothetical protein